FKTAGQFLTGDMLVPTFSVSSPTGGSRLLFGASVPVGGEFYMARAAFSDSPGVDFRNLSRLQFGMVRFSQDGTFTISSIESVAIPEPGTGLLLAAGAGLLSIAARRR